MFLKFEIGQMHKYYYYLVSNFQSFYQYATGVAEIGGVNDNRRRVCIKSHDLPVL